MPLTLHSACPVPFRPQCLHLLLVIQQKLIKVPLSLRLKFLNLRDFILRIRLNELSELTITPANPNQDVLVALDLGVYLFLAKQVPAFTDPGNWQVQVQLIQNPSDQLVNDIVLDCPVATPAIVHFNSRFFPGLLLKLLQNERLLLQ